MPKEVHTVILITPGVGFLNVDASFISRIIIQMLKVLGVPLQGLDSHNRL